MPTDFLNRRMDLIHTKEANIFCLTMDTSYPVKLAGKVIKIFTAGQDYDRTLWWAIRNSSNDYILTVSVYDVYDFAGRLIANSIGEGKAYPSEKAVFKKDDYVMAIIDFDKKSMYLCSQTNFESFITGGGGGGDDEDKETFKLFNITGLDDEVQEYKVDNEVFDAAVLFENDEEGTHAFLRHSSDNIIYQVPSNNNGVRDMIPVAKVNSVNINSLNNAIQNFIFLFINESSVGDSVESVAGVMAYRTLNGTLSDKFIDESFTYEELKNLSWLNSGYVKTEINNIAEAKRGDYRYVLTSNKTDKKQSLTSDIRFLPISKTKKFTSLSIIDGTKIDCADGVDISISLRPNSNYKLIGNWWSNDTSKGYSCTWMDDDYVTMNIDDDGLDSVTGGVKSFSQIGSSIHKYNAWYSDRQPRENHRISNLTNTTKYNNFFNTEKFKPIKRFIEFFGNEDTEYMDFIKRSAVTLFCQSKDRNIHYEIDSDPIPCNIIEYPSVFENVLFDSDSSGNYTHNSEVLHNFTSFYNDSFTNFNRLDYKTNNVTVRDLDNDRFEIYNLTSLNETDGTCFKHDSKKSQRVENKDFNITYKSNMSLIGNTDNNMIIGRNSLYKNKCDYLMLNLINKLNLTRINTAYSESEEPLNYNNSQIGHRSFLAMRMITLPSLNSMALQVNPSTSDTNFNYDSAEDRYYIYLPDICFNKLKVYTVKINSDKSVEYVELNRALFKDNSQTNGLQFMYLYVKYNTSLIQIKYYFSVSSDSIDSGYNPTSKINSMYDYYTHATIITVVSNMNIDRVRDYSCLVGYANILWENDNSITPEQVSNIIYDKKDSIEDILLEVVKYYKMSPCAKPKNEFIKVTTHFDIFTPVNIEVSHKYNRKNQTYIFYPNHINDASLNNGSGFRLADLIGNNDYTYYQNSMTPYVTTTSNNGADLYTLESYIKYLKDTKVSDNYITEEFKYINGIGIREEYYKNKSLYDFYNYILTRKLNIPITVKDSFKTMPIADKSFYSKEVVKSIDHVVKELDGTLTLYDKNNTKIRSIKPLMSTAGYVDPIHAYGFNATKLLDRVGNDVTDKYIEGEPVIMNETKTGNKSVYNISLMDGNTENPALLPLNGTLGVIESDYIKWIDLLIGLNNNKSLDVTGCLNNVKNQLDYYFLNSAQNVSDIYPVSGSVGDEVTQGHVGDDPYSSSDPMHRDEDASFDNTHNLYNFYDGYGYDMLTNKRMINNRGVVVFVCEGSESFRTRIDFSDNFTYSATKGKVYPKRMYISPDGILCTKEYYDNSIKNATGRAALMSLNDDTSDLTEQVNTLKEALTDTVNFISSLSTDKYSKEELDTLNGIKDKLNSVGKTQEELEISNN